VPVALATLLSGCVSSTADPAEQAWPDAAPPEAVSQLSSSEGGLDLEMIAPSDARPSVAYLDAAGTAEDIRAGEVDVLRGLVDGEPVAVALVEHADRQQAQPALVADPADEAVVYYNAVVGLRACMQDSSGRCTAGHDLRRADLRTGTDELVLASAISVALRPDGALATVRLDPAPQQLGAPPRGHVAVRDVDGAWQQWTSEPGGYHVLGWAGDELLVAVDVPGGREGHDEVAVLSGPDRLRPLTQPPVWGLVQLVGISPDGGRALVRAARDDGGDASLLLVRIRTGEILGRIEFAGHDGGLSVVGAWLGPDDAVVSSSLGGTPVLQRLRLAKDRIVLAESWKLGPGQRQGIYAIAPAARNRVAMIVGAPDPGTERSRGFYADCDLTDSRCQVHHIGLSGNSSYLATR
jgi:hypothetical protein